MRLQLNMSKNWTVDKHVTVSLMLLSCLESEGYRLIPFFYLLSCSSAYSSCSSFFLLMAHSPFFFFFIQKEIKVPSGENTELKRSPVKVWSRSEYSHTYYAYCQEFLPRLFLPFRSIHLHFFQNLSQFFPALAVANTGSCVGPRSRVGHPVGCRFPCWVPAEYKKAKNMTCGMMTSEMNDLDIEWSLCSALM